jgi:hypothetical protein
MTTKRWREFTRITGKLVKESASDVWVRKAVSRNDYVGQPEDSRTWVFDLDSNKLKALDTALKVLTIDFGQESIARTAGTTRLVGIE